MTYKRKNQLLLGGFVFFGLLVFVVSIRPTWDLYSRNSYIKADLDAVQRAPKTIAQLEKELTFYTTILQSFGSNALEREQFILNRVSEVCKKHQVLLTALPASALSTQNNYELETRKIRIRGNFKNMLRVIYELEYKKPVGRISGVKFNLEEERKTKQLQLFTDFYIQNLKVSNNAI